MLEVPLHGKAVSLRTIEQTGVILTVAPVLMYPELFLNHNATMFALQQLVEHIKNLSNEFKQDHSEIPWTEIVGFRNRIVHEYGKTDYTTVYEIITNGIYQLKELFESCI